ncbi:HotDog domain-containing protein [Xylaria nigripes]|nr:HotDog domain-containing protein [Xylaria nigripes]
MNRSKTLNAPQTLDGLHKVDGLEKVERFLEWARGKVQNDWSESLLQRLSIASYSASPSHPYMTFRFTVEPSHANSYGTLHGGCAASLFDICTAISLQMISRPGFWENSGVSRNLNVTYLRPVRVGTTVDIECEIMHAGKTLCSLRAVMRTTTDDGTKGPVLCTCEHGKVATNVPVPKI